MAGSMMVFPLLLAFSTAAISLAHSDTKVPPPIFVFGDSLSDVGNNNDLPHGYRADHPHYGIDFPGGVPTGRFTNGYNIIDVIAQHMGFEESPPSIASVNRRYHEIVKRGINFASGGSGILVECVEGTHKKCRTIKDMISSFAIIRILLPLVLGVDDSAVREILAKSIFIITCGVSDINGFILSQLVTKSSVPVPIDDLITNMTSTLRDHLKQLYNLGARKFALINVPPAGVMPVGIALEKLIPFGSFVQGILNGYSRKFNIAQYNMVKELSSTLPGMKYSIGNAYAAFMDLVGHPEEHGMKDVTSPCCGQVQAAPQFPYVNVIECTAAASYCSNRSEYVFWDPTQPTQVVIQYASELFYNGNLSYATPMNLKQLVEYESSGGSVGRGMDRIEAM